MTDTSAVADRIGAAAARWLETLDEDQRRRARFGFDEPERFVWDYLPGARRGLSFADMTEPQRDAAIGLVGTSMSERGATEVQAVIDLELILRELERGTGKDLTRRDPGRYGFAIFGEPAGAEPWSWRVGGHHVAIQVTIAGGRVIGTTPSFLGANPATVPYGPMAGHRTLDGEERLARTLLASLTVPQRRLAIVDPVAPADILSGSGRRAELRDVPAGIRHDALGASQRTALEALVRYYVGRGQPAVADAEWSRIRDAGLDAVTFAWAGPDEPGQGHYYAVHGPRLLIEYDNTQNGANHIHSVWRDPTNDWGEDLLAAHYRAAHEPDQGRAPPDGPAATVEPRPRFRFMMSVMEPPIVAFDTSLGTCAVRWTDAGIAGVRLPSPRTAGLPRVEDRAGVPQAVRAAIAGIVAVLDGSAVDLGFVILDERGIDPLRRAVYAATRTISPGTIATYGDVARAIGRPDAARDVGAALARNPFPIVVPCHRVLGANGKLTGFSAPGGLETKRRMLELEGAPGFGQQVLFG